MDGLSCMMQDAGFRIVKAPPEILRPAPCKGKGNYRNRGKPHFGSVLVPSSRDNLFTIRMLYTT